MHIYIQNMKICQIHSSTRILFKMNSCLKPINTEEILTGTHKHRTICLQCPIFFSEKTFFKTWDLTTKTRDYIPSLLRRLADLTTQSHQRDPYNTRKSAQTFFYLYLICPAERDEELDLFVGNPALLRRILTWSGLVKRARSVPLFLRGVLMFL